MRLEDLLGWAALALFVPGLILVLVAGAPLSASWQTSTRARRLQLFGIVLLAEAIAVLPVRSLLVNQLRTPVGTAFLVLALAALLVVPVIVLTLVRRVHGKTAQPVGQPASRTVSRAMTVTIVAGVAIPMSLLVYNYQLCACGSRTMTAERLTRRAMQEVIEAQQSFFYDSLRLAPTLGELSLEVDAAVQLDLEVLDSTRFRVAGRSLHPRGVTCSAIASLTTTRSDPIGCSGRAPGPLGF